MATAEELEKRVTALDNPKKRSKDAWDIVTALGAVAVPILLAVFT